MQDYFYFLPIYFSKSLQSFNLQFYKRVLTFYSPKLPFRGGGATLTCQTSHHPYQSSSALPMGILYASENNPSPPRSIFLLN